MILIAVWQTSGKDFLRLYIVNPYDHNWYYKYEGNGCGGILSKCDTNEDAIKWMEENPVKVLKSDKPSLKRTY